MNCNEWARGVESWLSEQWHDGTAPAVPQALSDHAVGCPACGRRLAAALLLVDGAALRAPAPPGLEARTMARLRARRAAAGATRQLFPVGRPAWTRLAPRILIPAAAAVVAAVSLFAVLRVSRPLEPAVASQPAVAAQPAVVRVVLVLEAPYASRVSAVGDWNAWDPRANPLSDPDGDGVWTVEIQVPPGAEIRYQFLVDDEDWVPDPRAPFQVDDGFGGTASILQI